MMRDQARIVLNMARRDLKNRYASSYAGAAWNIGIPLIYSLINVVVFSILMSGRMGAHYGDVPFALFYFIPFSLWAVFAEVAVRSTGILREYGYLINKIAFPVWSLPLVPLGSALLTQAILFAIVLALMSAKAVAFSSNTWIFGVVWLMSLLMTVGIAYFVSAVSVYIPDMGQLVPVGVNILFWLTPILYPARLVEKSDLAWMRYIIMEFNPFYYMTETSRLALIGSHSPPWGDVAVFAACAIVMLGMGILVFRKLQPGFADVL